MIIFRVFIEKWNTVLGFGIVIEGVGKEKGRWVEFWKFIFGWGCYIEIYMRCVCFVVIIMIWNLSYGIFWW